MFRLPTLRRRTLLLPLALSALHVAPTAVADPPSNRNWVKTFDDNFNGNLNTNIWTVQTGRWKDSVRKPQNIFTQNGNLVIRTSKSGSEYQTGFIRTRNGANLTFSQKYGYFETRMKLDTARGQWAAFWLMPKGTIHNVDRSGRDGTEIDIVEGFAHKQNATINQAIHYDGYGPSEVSVLNAVNMNGTANQWHTYAVEWTPTKYTWYVDGVATWTINDPKQISQVKQYMKLTSEVKLGTNWVGAMDDSKLPADTLVDYVRVWRDAGPASGGGNGGGGGASSPPTPPPTPPTPPATGGQTVEVEKMQLARLTKVGNNSASGGSVTKVSAGHTVGYAKLTYGGSAGNQPINISYVNHPGSSYIKLVINNAVKKTWPLTGTGGIKQLNHTTYLKPGDVVQLKAAGAVHLDKLSFGSGGGGNSGGGTSTPPSTPPASGGQTVEIEKMQLARMTKIGNGSASGGAVTKVSPGQTVGYAKLTYGGSAGNQPLNISYVNHPGSAYIKLVVNNAVKKTWPLTGSGGIKQLNHTTYLKPGDVVQIKAAGAVHLDKLSFGSGGSGNGGSTGGGNTGGGTTPSLAPSSKSFEAEKMKLVRMSLKDKYGSSSNTVVRVTPGQAMGLVEIPFSGAGGNRTMRMTVFDQANGDLVKFYVNGQIKKSWVMNGGGNVRTLEYQGNFNSGDTLTYKVWGTTMLDKLQY